MHLVPGCNICSYFGKLSLLCHRWFYFPTAYTRPAASSQLLNKDTESSAEVERGGDGMTMSADRTDMHVWKTEWLCMCCVFRSCTGTTDASNMNSSVWLAELNNSHLETPSSCPRFKPADLPQRGKRLFDERRVAWSSEIMLHGPILLATALRAKTKWVWSTGTGRTLDS